MWRAFWSSKIFRFNTSLIAHKKKKNWMCSVDVLNVNWMTMFKNHGIKRFNFSFDSIAIYIFVVLNTYARTQNDKFFFLFFALTNYLWFIDVFGHFNSFVLFLSTLNLLEFTQLHQFITNYLWKYVWFVRFILIKKKKKFNQIRLLLFLLCFYFEMYQIIVSKNRPQSLAFAYNRRRFSSNKKKKYFRNLICLFDDYTMYFE